MLALALLRNGRVDEAANYLETVRKLAGKKDKQDGYATLASLLSQVEDKPAALRVMGQFRIATHARLCSVLLRHAGGCRRRA